MFRRKIKHTQRYQEIINAFLKNGLSHFLFRVGLIDREKRPQNSEENNNLKDMGMRLCSTLQGLGPTFIKLGQIASSRRDMIPEEIASELEKLQDDVLPFSYEKVSEIVESELGEPVDRLFKTFSETPLATASIGQVHAAQLFSGEEVAVKVQRPDIRAIIDIDLEILHDLARVIEKRVEWARRYRVREMIEEFSLSLQNELDYEVEGRNGERIATQFKNVESIHIPKIHWELTSKKVLTMEMIKGIKVTQVDELDKNGFDRELIAARLAESMFTQVLEYGFFHGDPHPGNIYILPNNVIAYLDFGMVGQLREDLKYHFASLLINLQKGSSKGMIKIFSAMDLLDENTDVAELKYDLDGLIGKYYDTSFNEISMGAALTDVFAIAYRHRVRIPTEIAILGKAILTMEEIIKKLDPYFSVMKAVEPIGEKLFKQRLSPKNILSRSLDDIIENIEIIRDFPKDLKEITTTVKRGRLRFDINVKELQTFLQRLDKISNRLSFSIILLSFSILMVGLIIGTAIADKQALLFRLPVIEIGSIIATLMFLFMIFSIFRSGRM
ncbi:MAG TPA: AarF/ABC1/UbiB kinase family protein [Bacillus bacterium]|uniref:ABC transporter n=1 Tax=Siminovitchia fordii TaxID=254759 RepID=A0ABQ4K7P7_9BACI|nr:AarF/ABC1/UbiB kinase family protein [Siminovitchia fordii]GIN20976.1 ABC transporter [Siminovitchia fordii]HBZ09327.1 AarF/ABC1/UbiB kinase family protein [Bacillus sp. (in: firmicutes)]